MGTSPRSSCKSPCRSDTVVSHRIQYETERNTRITLGSDSCMFHVTIRTLRNVGCRGCAVGKELFPSCDDVCVEWGPCGRRACNRVNRAVKQRNDVSQQRLLRMQDTENAPGREGPASDVEGCCCSGVAKRFMETDRGSQGRVNTYAGTSWAMRNTCIICNNHFSERRPTVAPSRLHQEHSRQVKLHTRSVPTDISK